MTFEVITSGRHLNRNWLLLFNLSEQSSHRSRLVTTNLDNAPFYNLQSWLTPLANHKVL